MVLLLCGIGWMPTAVIAVATSCVLLMLMLSLSLSRVMAIMAIFVRGLHAGWCGRCVRLHLLMVGRVLSGGCSLAPCGGWFGGAGAQLWPAVGYGRRIRGVKVLVLVVVGVGVSFRVLSLFVA
jgi:hypothetical protein